MLRMSVPGERSEADKAKPVVGGAGAEVLDGLGIGVTVTDAVEVAGKRAASAPVVLEADRRDEVVEVRLEGNVRLYLPPEQVPKLLAAPPGRAAAVPGTVPLASTLTVGDGTRGIAEWAIEGLRVIGVDLAGKTAAAVAERIDRKLVPEPGLMRWNGALTTPVREPLPVSSEPWLLFLHGTFSNTQGSFGKLAAQTAQWRRLQAAYPDRILGLDHHTLTRSPIDNARDALALLPEGAPLHLLGYSRGGLVGELLCRGALENRALPFDADELALFADPGYGEQQAALLALGKSLTALQPKIGRYVRVACPARGTTLASDRIDRWLNLVLNAIGLALGAAAGPFLGEAYDLVTAFLLAVIKEKADASTIPGLEAMIPGSPLIKMLNRPGVVAKTDLAVLEGDIQGAGILGRLKVLATDLFFREDHDLVVNTSAMTGGMARTPVARAFFTQGPEVSHFNYFVNPKTAERVVDGLLRADDADGGFKPAAVPELAGVPTAGRRGGEKRPVAFVLPGITGTVLWWKDKRIWLDLPQLAFGGLRRLAIDVPDITAKEPLALYYGALCTYLGSTHEVRPWGYDWRRSIQDNARDFATALNGALAGTDQPVRIVAHSMGGLVARSAFLDPKLWKRFQDRAGSRLIQLGTPNGGSWSIPYMLMGRDTLMGYLATLDFTMSRRDQQAVVARFPGALQMLPHDDATMFEPARWAALSQLDPGDEDWVLPRPEDLAAAARFRDAFATAPLDPERLLYVAGHAPTMVGIDEDAGAVAGQRISFRVSQEGDGQVPWRTGIPPGIRAWYAEAVHGDLARHQPAFPAIVDLLERGTTNLLPTTPPAALRGPGVLRAKVRDTVPMFPDAVDLALAGMGGTREPTAEQAAAPIRIKVVHGHLAFARHPVLVGHYAGDTINGAEAELDEALRGRLAKRKQFGLYPGALGTSTVALDRTTRPKGAVVVGLGDHADLAPGTLAETLRRGILAYAIENDDARCAQGEAGAVGPLGLTALLVGAGVGGLPIASSIEALLRAAMEAQRALGGNGLRELEVIELVEDRANRAWHVLHRALQGSEFKDGFELDPTVEPTFGRRRNVSGDSDPSWWQPIQVTMENVGSERVMRYVTTAGRARAEASLVPGNTGFVERFVAQATGVSATSGRPTAAGRALFELLWPERIKEMSREDRNVRLVLDERTAAFPWELLDDRRPWLETADAAGGERPKPAAVRAGLVRQLVQTQFREKVVAPADRRRALVVGDPRAEPQEGFPPLPGAEEESLAVAERLAGAGFQVTHLHGDKVTPEQVVSALFEQAWNIVHIAAHGVFDYKVRNPDGTSRRETGVVLGGGLFLGPSILDQLPVVPAIVFVNCCHLGHVDAAAEAANTALTGKRPDLAASVAVQLVRMGVRGVLAAGWPVDDINAGRFAGGFYDTMLRGGRFGEAVRAARLAIYREGSADTTWGAYQCYGEPDWRLEEDGALATPDERLVMPSLAEAVAMAERIRESAQVGLNRDHTGLRAELDALNQARRRNAQLDRPELQAALAEAYGELGSLQKAVRYYQGAIAAKQGAVSLKAIEQYANLKARLAVRRAAKAKAQEERDAAVAAIDEALDALDKLIALAGPTVERLNLKGSAYKRLAVVQHAQARKAALAQMRAWYQKAQELATREGDHAYYSQLMVITAEILAQHADGTPGDAERRKRLRRIAGSQRKGPDSTDFWAGVAVGDALLLAAIDNGEISAKEEAEIVQAYLEPWRRGGSRLKLSSVTEQLEFLAAMLAEGPPSKAPARQHLIAGLDRIRARIEKPG